MVDERGRLADTSAHSEKHWLGYREARPDDGADFRLGSIARPPVAPPPGVSTQQLAEFQRRFATYARLRLLGPGADQYVRDGKQKFESLSPRQLVQELLDELADIVNYAAMLAIQLQRLPDRLEEEL